MRFPVLALLCLILPLIAACDDPKPTAAPAAKPAVGVQPAAMKGVSRSYEFVGRIKATQQVDLRARVEGFLEQVAFREGQDVKAGDLLYRIEKVQYQAAVDQAKANLAAAQALVVNDQLQYARQLQLSRDKFSPQSTVDKEKATLDSDQAKVLQMQAVLTQAEVNLDYTGIRAPIDGRIGRTAYTIGNLVNSASGVLATIVSQDPIYVLFPISLRELEAIRQARRQENGDLTKIEIRVRLPNGDEYPQPGRWNLTDPQVDQRTDTVIMRATIPNPDRRLVDGEFVTSIIRERREQPRLVIPQVALQVDQSGYYALVVDGEHKVVQHRVATGPELGADVVVVSGVKEGDKVIVDGVQKVRPGQVVQEALATPAETGK